MIISVVIPTYNRAAATLRALDSVAKQTRPPEEVFVVDDGSTDETVSQIHNWSAGKTLPFRLEVIETGENRGVSHARNLGIERAHGEWLAFLDSDDVWLPEKLEKQLLIVEQDPLADWIHCHEIWERNGKTIKIPKHLQKEAGDLFARSCDICVVGASCVLIKKDILKALGGFREDLPVCEDFDLWIKLAARSHIGFVSEPLVIKYAGHADQLSTRFHSMDFFRFVALKDNLRLPLSHAQRDVLTEALMRKAKILLKGYEKHQNWNEFENVASYLAAIEHSIA